MLLIDPVEQLDRRLQVLELEVSGRNKKENRINKLEETAIANKLELKDRLTVVENRLAEIEITQKQINFTNDRSNTLITQFERQIDDFRLFNTEQEKRVSDLTKKQMNFIVEMNNSFSEKMSRISSDFDNLSLYCKEQINTI